MMLGHILAHSIPIELIAIWQLMLREKSRAWLFLRGLASLMKKANHA